jgi:hypothetical protein
MELSDEALDRWRVTGDPPADACIARSLARRVGPGAISDLIATLMRGETRDDPVIDDYLARSPGLPDRAEPDAILRAQFFFVQQRQAVYEVLCFAALPESYCNVAVADLLRRQSSLADDPTRRVSRAAQFVQEVLTPGGLDDGSPGRVAIQRVRLLHAALRAQVGSQLEHASAGGVPLNQEDLAGTLLTFSWLTVIRLARYGVPVSPAQARDLAHTWNVVGSLLGIAEELLPDNADDAATLLGAIRRRHYGSSAAGRALTAQLLSAYGPWVSPGAPQSDGGRLVRHLLGDELADLLAV